MSLLSPSLSSAPSGGEGARRAGEEALWFLVPMHAQKTVETSQEWERAAGVLLADETVCRRDAGSTLEHFKFLCGRERTVGEPGTSSPRPSPPFRMEERVPAGRERRPHTHFLSVRLRILLNRS